MQNEIRQFVIDALKDMNYDITGVDDDTTLGPAGVDLESLALAELAIRVEGAYGVKFGEEESEQLASMTVGEFTSTVAERIELAATMPGSPVLLDELVRVVEGACDEAGLSTMERAETPLLLAVHGDPRLARAGLDERAGRSAGALAVALAERCGLGAALRAYTS